MNKFVLALRVISTLTVSCLICNVGSCLAKELSKIEQHGVIAKVPRIRIEATKLKRALSNFRMRQIRVGSRTFTLNHNGFRHILTQHHPRFMDLTHVKRVQTFFDKKIEPDEILDLFDIFVKQNRHSFSKLPLNKKGQVEGVINGVTYIVGVDYNGTVYQFFPKGK